MPSAWTLCALALCSPLQDGGATAKAPSLLEAAPASASVAVVVEDLQALVGRVRASAWAELLRAPQLAELRAALTAQIAENLPAGIELDDLLALPRSTLFYVDHPGDDERNVFGAALRLEGGSSGARAWLASELGELGEAVEHGGRVLVVQQDSDAWIAWIDAAPWLVVFRAQRREAALEGASALLGRLEPGAAGKGLATRLGERRRMATGGLEVYFDLGGTVAAEKTGLGEGEEALWKAFALDDLGWISLQAAVGPGIELDALAELDLPAEGILARWAACARPLPLELVRHAPAHAVEVAVLGFDLASAWRTLREELAAAWPEAATQIGQGLEAAKAAAGADLERDVIGQLTGEFAGILLPVTAAESAVGELPSVGFSAAALAFSGLPGSSPGAVVLIGLRETAPVEDLFESLLELAGAGENVDDEQVGGRWMTSIAVPELPIRPTWAFLDGALALSMHAEPVRAVLRQAAEGAPPGWLASEANRSSLGDVDGAFFSSTAHLAEWLEAEIVAPAQSLASLLPMALVTSVGELGPPELEAAARAFLAALPGLVDEHLRGTLRSAIWIEAQSLRYRAWTR